MKNTSTSPLINVIVESHCSFEVSKLLKELGFDVYTKAVWVEYHTETTFHQKGKEFQEDGILHGVNSRYGQGNEYSTIYSAPTISVAKEWVGLNFHYHISAEVIMEAKYGHKIIPTSKSEKFLFIMYEDFPTPHQAENAALFKLLEAIKLRKKII